jgi:hypothetical protein
LSIVKDTPLGRRPRNLPKCNFVRTRARLKEAAPFRPAEKQIYQRARRSGKELYRESASVDVYF